MNKYSQHYFNTYVNKRAYNPQINPTATNQPVITPTPPPVPFGISPSTFSSAPSLNPISPLPISKPNLNIPSNLSPSPSASSAQKNRIVPPVIRGGMGQPSTVQNRPVQNGSPVQGGMQLAPMPDPVKQGALNSIAQFNKLALDPVSPAQPKDDPNFNPYAKPKSPTDGFGKAPKSKDTDPIMNMSPKFPNTDPIMNMSPKFPNTDPIMNMSPKFPNTDPKMNMSPKFPNTRI